MNYKKVFKINWDCNEDSLYYDFDYNIRYLKFLFLIITWGT